MKAWNVKVTKGKIWGQLANMREKFGKLGKKFDFLETMIFHRFQYKKHVLVQVFSK